jgi:hypothetical protein
MTILSEEKTGMHRNDVRHRSSKPAHRLKALKKIGFLVCALAALSALAVRAQNAGLQEKIVALKKSATENKQALSQYQWTETVQLTLKGDLKPPRQFSCKYGPDGQVVKTPVGPEPEDPSDHGLKEKIIEKKKAELQQYLQDAKETLAMYQPPDAQRMQAAYQAGHVSFNPVPGAMVLSFTDYAQPGDKMSVTLNTSTNKISALTIDTYMGKEKDAVTLKVTMAALPDGTSYPQQSILDGTAKKVTVTTTSSNYQKL